MDTLWYAHTKDQQATMKINKLIQTYHIGEIQVTMNN